MLKTTLKTALIALGVAAGISGGLAANAVLANGGIYKKVPGMKLVAYCAKGFTAQTVDGSTYRCVSKAFICKPGRAVGGPSIEQVGNKQRAAYACYTPPS